MGKDNAIMNMPEVWTFFYGSYINRDVLAEVKYHPVRYEAARLAGFDIEIRPLANLVRSDMHTVFGILATATHEELRRLYAHAKDVLGGTYLPEAVLAQTVTGYWISALCYIAPWLSPARADNDYIDRIVGPGRKYGFPEWYIDRLESFR